MRRPGNTTNPAHYPVRRAATGLVVLVTALLSTGTVLPDKARISGPSADDTVSIHAENAWEGTAADTIHFSGRFELKSPNWHLSAERATLYGDMDDPETAKLTGSPARIELKTSSADRFQTVSGKALRIIYNKASNSIRLEGAASLTTADQTMQSEKIEYDIGRDRVLAGGEQGVRIRVEPEN